MKLFDFYLKIPLQPLADSTAGLDEIIIASVSKIENPAPGLRNRIT